MSTTGSGEDERREDRNGTAASLAPGALYRRTDLSALGIETSGELEVLSGVVGQARASRALSFGVAVRREGFHVYALGPEETRKRTIVEHFVRERAAEEPIPDDICYVNDFEDPHRPRCLHLPPGRGRRLAHHVDQALEGLVTALRGSFESEEYQTRRQAVAEEAGEEHQEALEGLQQRARERGLALVRTPSGFVVAPVREGEVLSPAEVAALDEEDRKAAEAGVKELQEELQQILRKVPRQKREMQDRLRDLDREVARITIRDHLERIREEHDDLPQVRAHVDRMQDDMVEHVHGIVRDGDSGDGSSGPRAGPGRGLADPLERPELRRYRVNVIVDHGASEHAPVIYEDHPTYPNLVGRVEYVSVMGALLTDFNLIRAGALHRANGGYLILEVHRLLQQPLAWEGLKRALQSCELRLETPHSAAGLASTLTLDAEPVPVEIKVVLLGSRRLYYMLSQLDPDFPGLFKVAADFDDRLDRSPEDEATYARLLADLIRREELLPFHRSGLERVMEWSARMAGDSEKLSAHTSEVLDLMREADHWCREDGRDVVTGDDVLRAVDEWRHRSSRVRDHLQEEIVRETILISTEGTAQGQVNGLAVLQLGGFAFGRPNRITARVRVGKGEVTDIEREVELGGPLHSKGVLILASFLGARYAREQPLSIQASLVFEQSYSGVDGDSASAAELFALLSAIGRIPLRQSVAITGSVNQHGEVQAIGGVNEKIEGFFEVCRARGLTGDQGVLIPTANVKHLMLRPEVVEAVEEGRFHVWPIDHVDQGMEILTGLPMGERDGEERYPEGSVNRKVEDRLAELARLQREFSQVMRDGAGEDSGG